MAMRAMQNKPPEPYFPVLHPSRNVEGASNAIDVIHNLNPGLFFGDPGLDIIFVPQRLSRKRLGDLFPNEQRSS